MSESDLKSLLSVDTSLWKKELEEIRTYLQSYGNRLPAELLKQLDAVEAKLG